MLLFKDLMPLLMTQFSKHRGYKDLVVKEIKTYRKNGTVIMRLSYDQWKKLLNDDNYLIWKYDASHREGQYILITKLFNK